MSDRVIKVYLVVSGKGDVRVFKKRPNLKWDEVAYPITVQIPGGWGVVYEKLGARLTLPEPPDKTGPLVGAPETDEDQETES